MQVNQRLRKLYPNLVGETVDQLKGVGASVSQDLQTDHLWINGQFSALIVLGRCRSTPTGHLRWNIELEQEKPPDITVAVRMDAGNERITDCYLLPFIDLAPATLRLQEDNPAPIETYRFDTLEYFVGLASRTVIEVAA